MKLINTLLTILFISLLSSPSWSETLGDLVERDGLYYQKFTDVPFTGKITGGSPQGSIKNGVKEGLWVQYWENGQFSVKVNYKNGKLKGALVGYWDNGQLRERGNYKDGKQESAWVGYMENGELWYKGNFRNGKQEGAWVQVLIRTHFSRHPLGS